jgi:hypothetical protein
MRFDPFVTLSVTHVQDADPELMSKFVQPGIAWRSDVTKETVPVIPGSLVVIVKDIGLERVVVVSPVAVTTKTGSVFPTEKVASREYAAPLESVTVTVIVSVPGGVNCPTDNNPVPEIVTVVNVSPEDFLTTLYV